MIARDRTINQKTVSDRQWPSLAPLAHQFGRAFANLVFPPLCLTCHTRTFTHNALCAHCWSQIEFLRPPLCDRLGIPLPFDPGGKTVSPAAIANPPAFDRARAVANYSGPLRKLIHRLKYHDRHEARTLFDRWLTLAGTDLLEDADILLPVPLHWTRNVSRRFNQAALLAQDLSRSTEIPANPFVLQRTKRTKTQVGLTSKQRQKNVLGAFKVCRRLQNQIAGKNVLLIDDVLTSGATVSACAKILKKAGAANVDVLTLARVCGPQPASF